MSIHWSLVKEIKIPLAVMKEKSVIIDTIFKNSRAKEGFKLTFDNQERKKQHCSTEWSG